MLVKRLVFIALLLFSVSAMAHTSISISVGGGPAYYPTPIYYGPPVMEQRIVWVPAHREYRYWVPGHYVEYATPMFESGRVWAHNNRHWHRG